MNKMYAVKGRTHRVFCANVRARRMELDLTMRAVGELLGISAPSYTQIEMGRRVPSLDVVERVAKALQTSVVALLTPIDRKASA